jgi:hypothetical protein
MPPLSLSDVELSQVMNACAPLAPDRREAFLQTVADQLARCTVIGPGVVHRVVRETQPQFFDPPDLSHASGAVPLKKIARL